MALSISLPPSHNLRNVTWLSVKKIAHKIFELPGIISYVTVDFSSMQYRNKFSTPPFVLNFFKRIIWIEKKTCFHILQLLFVICLGKHLFSRNSYKICMCENNGTQYRTTSLPQSNDEGHFQGSSWTREANLKSRKAILLLSKPQGCCHTQSNFATFLPGSFSTRHDFKGADFESIKFTLYITFSNTP